MNINKRDLCLPFLDRNDPNSIYKSDTIITPRDIISQIVDTLKQPHTAHHMWVNDEAAAIYTANKQLYNEIAKHVTKDAVSGASSSSDSGSGSGSNKNNMNLKLTKLNDWTLLCVLWKQIRLIWIGYYKNNENNNCLIRFLPKDIVKQIIIITGYQLENLYEGMINALAAANCK